MSGSISFNYFTPTREPGVYIENNAVGNVSGGTQKICLVGQKGQTGTASNNMVVPVVSQANVNALCGVSSMLADMYSIAVQNNTVAQFYIMPVIGTSGSSPTNAVYSIAVTGPATNAGDLYFEVAGYPINVGVNAGDTATVIANNISSAFNTNPNAPVTCTAATGAVTVTVKPAGITAGDVPVLLNYLGTAGGQTTPTGVGITITETTMPAGDADMAAAIANLNGMGFSAIVNPYCNTTVISELTTYFNESTGQWSPIIGHGGVWFSGLKGTSAAISTFTDALNDPYGSIVGIPTSTSQPEYLITTACACAVMQSAAAAPQLPFQGIVLQGIQPWTTDFARSDRVLMLNNGASTLKVKNGQVVIDRVISLYETNSLGYADTSYLNLNVALQLMVVNSYITNYLADLYPRKAIVANGTPINASNNFTTPQAIGASAGVAYSNLCDLGICQNAAAVQKGITTSYANGQVSIFLPAQLTGQLEVIAINLTFSAG